MTDLATPVERLDPDLKGCCASLYEHEAARLLVGDSLHPGGLELTEMLGKAVGLGPGQTVLDVAAGSGTSAVFLAQRFGCHVTGIDYSTRNVEAARQRADREGIPDLVAFRQGDAENLPFDTATFDAIICECAFCLFPDKAKASTEFARVIAPGGWLGLSDLTRSGAIAPELEGLLGWIACIADALPVADYLDTLTSAGFDITDTLSRDNDLLELVDQVRLKLLGAEAMIGLGRLPMTAEDLGTAKHVAGLAHDAVKRGDLGYLALVAKRPVDRSPQRVNGGAPPPN